MAYIGAEPVPGQNREVDDISSGFNGNATAFTLQVSSVNVSPESANNILINLGGVLQNPGTDYTIAASTITFTTAPAAGLSFFGLILGAGINTATVADGVITNAKVNASAAIARTKLANVDVVDDTTPQLGGNLDVNTKNIVFGDSSDGSSDDVLSFGASGDLKIFHQADQSRIVESGPSVLKIMGSDVRLSNAGNTADYMQCNDGSDVQLFHNGGKKFFTISNGVQATNRIIVGESTNQRGLISGDSNGVTVGAISNIPVTFVVNSTAKCRIDGNDFKILNDSGKLEVGASQDFSITHNGTNSVLDNQTGHLMTMIPASQGFRVQKQGGQEDIINAYADGGVELYFNGSKKFKTINEGIKLTELQIAPSGTESASLMTFGGGGVTTNSNSYGHFYDRITAGGNTVAIRFRTAGNSVGQISFNNSATIYTTSSDYRLKENAVSISDGITRLKTLKPYRFNFKGESDIVDGFFAHEVTAVPEAVTGSKDEVVTQAMIDAKGYKVGALNSPIYQGIDQSKLVPLLTAALQEAVSKIETLETKVAALEAA